MARDIQLTTLANGVRVITDTVPTVESVALGVWANVGARHEKAEVNGVAHMVEHMMFKGTQKRNAQRIVDEIENVGGHMNAYTSRDITSYYIHLLKDDVSLGLDVLSDMYQHSALPDDELKKERHVILQEIGMCHDTPDDLVFDHFYETAFADQAAGRPILGPTDIVAAMPRDALQAHIDRFYTAENTVICAAGNIKHDEFVALAQDYFSDIKTGQSATFDAAHYTGGDRRTDKGDLEQAHIMLGFESLSRHDDDFYAMRALSAVLGGGMSSRLFQEVREKHGLVYSVYSFAQAMHDTGIFGIYAGTGAKDTAELMPVLQNEIGKIQSHVDERELSRVKAQIKASLLMGQESMTSRADAVARTLLHRERVYDQNDIIAKIDALNCDDITAVAKRIFTTKPTLTAIGPLDKLMDFDTLRAGL